MPSARDYDRLLPTSQTLAKYGMTADDFLDMCRRQQWKCPICQESLCTGRKLAIDHEHVKGWKARHLRVGKNGVRRKVRVMNPQERKQYVRGVLHSWCNRFVRRWMTLERADNILSYLEDFERRRHEH